MAQLREQRNLVKIVYNFYSLVSVDGKNYFENLSLANKGVVTRDKIFWYCHFNPVLLSDSTKDFSSNEDKINEQWVMNRDSQVQSLFQSCLDEGFLSPVVNEIEFITPGIKPVIEEVGIRVTGKGSDLLNNIGFISTYLGKYQFWTGAASIFILGAILKLIFG